VGDSVKRRRYGEDGEWGGMKRRRQDTGHGGEALVLNLT